MTSKCGVRQQGGMAPVASVAYANRAACTGSKRCVRQQGGMRKAGLLLSLLWWVTKGPQSYATYG